MKSKPRWNHLFPTGRLPLHPKHMHPQEQGRQDNPEIQNQVVVLPQRFVGIPFCRLLSTTDVLPLGKTSTSSVCSSTWHGVVFPQQEDPSLVRKFVHEVGARGLEQQLRGAQEEVMR